MAKSRLTETKTILSLSRWDGSTATYDDFEPGTLCGPRKSLQIDSTTFVDMGGPYEITVTIEPGDRLNGGD